MEKKRLNILLQHGDLLINGDINLHHKKLSEACAEAFRSQDSWANYKELRKTYLNNNPEPSGHFVKIEGVTYGISYRLFHDFSQIFQDVLDTFLFGNAGIGGKIEEFKKKTSDYLERYSPLKEEQIKWLSDTIIKQNIYLDNLIGEVSINDFKAGWIDRLFEDNYDLLEYFKFKMHKGEEIRNFYYSLFRFGPVGNNLRMFFLTDKMKKFYEVWAIEENIKFLQEKINELEEPKTPLVYASIQDRKIEINDLTARQLAMYCYYKGINSIYESTVLETLDSIGYTKKVTKSFIRTIIDNFEPFKKTTGQKEFDSKKAVWLKKDMEKILKLREIEETIKAKIENLLFLIPEKF